MAVRSSARITATAALLVATAVVTGCSRGDSEDPSGEPRPSERTSSAAPNDATHHEDDLHAHGDQMADPEDLDPPAVAVRFLTTWSRPDLAYGQWWAELEPLLNPQGQQAYASTDPSVVPRLTVSGDPVVERSTVDTSAVVWVPTDQGRFGVRLSRVNGDAAWLVSRLYFPESEGL